MEILTVAVMDPFNVYAPPSQESLESRSVADATEVQIRYQEVWIGNSHPCSCLDHNANCKTGFGFKFHFDAPCAFTLYSQQRRKLFIVIKDET